MESKNFVVFSNQSCKLGESPIWHPGRASLFWLDILQKRLFEKSLYSNSTCFDRSWELNEIGSSIALDGDSIDSLILISDKSFSRFSLSNKKLLRIVPLALPKGFRSNDGAVSPAGDFWFGSMEKSPTGQYGCIYSISSDGQISQQLNHVGIPNTFCWSKNSNKFYLSDSYQQKIFRYDNNVNHAEFVLSQKVFVDLSSTKATPDGGSMDENDNLWNAQWNGFKVQCYGSQGEVLHTINLPVPYVTSCAFGGPDYNYLFITSAKESMSKQEIEKYPLSGCTFKVKLPISGARSTPFVLESLNVS